MGGAEISPVLLTRLVNDVGDNPGPALDPAARAQSHLGALASDGGEGPIDADALRGHRHHGACAGSACREGLSASLADARQQQICEKIFKALTDKDRSARRSSSDHAWDAVRPHRRDGRGDRDVIDVFRKPSRSFLMPPAGERAASPTTVIDISHESLMRVWRQLNMWADEEARSARRYRRLAKRRRNSRTTSAGSLSRSGIADCARLARREQAERDLGRALPSRICGGDGVPGQEPRQA